MNALEQLHPEAPFALLTLVSWAACWLLRAKAPTLWAAVAAWGPRGSTIEHLAQALPSIVASAVVAAIGSGLDPWVAAKGAVAGALAPLWHHLLKAAPVPYRGAVRSTADGPASRRIIAESLRPKDTQ